MNPPAAVQAIAARIAEMSQAPVAVADLRTRFGDQLEEAARMQAAAAATATPTEGSEATSLPTGSAFTQSTGRTTTSALSSGVLAARSTMPGAVRIGLALAADEAARRAAGTSGVTGVSGASPVGGVSPVGGPAPAGTVLSAEQIARVAYDAGFRGEALVDMVAIARRESGGRTTATNEKGLDLSYGLWQINLLPWVQKGLTPPYTKAQLYDPAINARVAYGLYTTRGLQPWTIKGDPLAKTDVAAARAAVVAAGLL